MLPLHTIQKSYQYYYHYQKEVHEITRHGRHLVKSPSLFLPGRIILLSKPETIRITTIKHKSCILFSRPWTHKNHRKSTQCSSSTRYMPECRPVSKKDLIVSTQAHQTGIYCCGGRHGACSPTSEEAKAFHEDETGTEDTKPKDLIISTQAHQTGIYCCGGIHGACTPTSEEANAFHTASDLIDWEDQIIN